MATEDTEGASGQTGDTKREGPGDRPASAQQLERGTPIGRYVVLDVLGEGGMGVVYAAFDPELDRKVAIKLLQVKRERDQAWLLREAQALARLQHPNVIAVHDVGTLGDRVFVAMELADGSTLRQWLEDERRTWQHIVPIMRAAGVGLAAAHAAGLVHRDFKPENVIVGDDGRVRVMDFGLARLAHDTPSQPNNDLGLDSRPLLTEQLTQVGSVMGTPPYMAPELHAREPADPRSDQFAFGVTLYEALYRQRPYRREELIGPHATPPVPKEPPKTGVPARIQRAMLRALAYEREERFPSMDALLAELATDRRNRMIVSTAVGAAAAAAITLGVVKVTSSDPPSPGPPAPSCSDNLERFAGVWDAGVRRRIATQFRATNRTHAAATLDLLATELDGYMQRWGRTRLSVCRATRIEHNRSEAAFDLGMRCLDERVESVRGLTTLFAASPDAQLLDKAIQAVVRLPRVEACLDAAQGAVPPPSSPEDRRTLDELRREAAQLRAYRDAAKYAAGADKAASLVARAQRLGYRPLEAELLYLHGELLSGATKVAESERALRDAARLAGVAKDDRLVAQAYVLLVRVVGFQRSAYEEGLALRPFAENAIARAEAGDALVADLTFHLGALHLQKGEYDRAKETYASALELRTKVVGDQHPDVADVHNNLGGTLMRKGDLDGARRHFEKAIAIREQALGPAHPEIALPLANLGSLHQMQKRYDLATTHLERAARLLEEVLGPEHTNLGLTLNNLGELAVARKDCAAAVARYTRALAIFEKQGPTHPYVAYPLVGRAKCRADLEAEAVAAATDAERAVAILGAHKGDPTQIAEARFVLARALWTANTDRPRARTVAAEAAKAFAAAGAAHAEALAEVTAWQTAHP